MERKLRFITDSAHGWLEVPAMDVLESGYIPSQFSYQGIIDDVGYVYLEEDCDLSGFIRKFDWTTIDELDQYLETVHVNGQCWIRNLPHCDGIGWISPFAHIS